RGTRRGCARQLVSSTGSCDTRCAAGSRRSLIHTARSTKYAPKKDCTWIGMVAGSCGAYGSTVGEPPERPHRNLFNASASRHNVYEGSFDRGLGGLFWAPATIGMLTLALLRSLGELTAAPTREQPHNDPTHNDLHQNDRCENRRMRRDSRGGSALGKHEWP